MPSPRGIRTCVRRLNVLLAVALVACCIHAFAPRSVRTGDVLPHEPTRSAATSAEATLTRTKAQGDHSELTAVNDDKSRLRAFVATWNGVVGFRGRPGAMLCERAVDEVRAAVDVARSGPHLPKAISMDAAKHELARADVVLVWDQHSMDFMSWLLEKIALDVAFAKTGRSVTVYSERLPAGMTIEVYPAHQLVRPWSHHFAIARSGIPVRGIGLNLALRQRIIADGFVDDAELLAMNARLLKELQPTSSKILIVFIGGAHCLGYPEAIMERLESRSRKVVLIYPFVPDLEAALIEQDKSLCYQWVRVGPRSLRYPWAKHIDEYRR
jgi:hypothetical protein